MSNPYTDTGVDHFTYHSNRTLKALQDELDKTKSTKLKVEIAGAIDRMLYTQIEREKTAKLKDGWGE